MTCDAKWVLTSYLPLFFSHGMMEKIFSLHATNTFQNLLKLFKLQNLKQNKISSNNKNKQYRLLFH